MTKVPVLESERLRLRGHRLDDFAACAAMWADPEVTRYIGGKPLGEEECWKRMLRYVGHWSLLGYGYWVAEEKTTGKYVGEVGFAEHKREMEPSIRGVPEIGWVVAAEAQGQGFATEAVRSAVAWGDRHLGRIRTACIIDAENLGSIRVAEKCGYRQLQVAKYKGRDTLLFVRDGVDGNDS